MTDYQTKNAQVIDRWCENGWRWGQPISHEEYEKALRGEWGVYLTPTKLVPEEWFGALRGKRVLGLASGGGQLKVGFRLTGLYEDTNGEGRLHEYRVPTFAAVRAVKPED